MACHHRRRVCLNTKLWSCVVYGVDWMSGANELVTALLEDPFASDEQKQVLRSRWTQRPEGSRTIRIQCVRSIVVFSAGY